MWLHNGVDIKTVSAWLGHASAAFTLKTYVHFMGSAADLAAVARVNAALSQVRGANGGRGSVPESASKGN